MSFSLSDKCGIWIKIHELQSRLILLGNLAMVCFALDVTEVEKMFGN